MTATRDLYDRVTVPTYAPAAPVFTRGAGSRLYDEGGREYIDFGGGIAVLSLGHCAPAISDAVAEQARLLMHVSNLHVNAPAVKLAQLLTENTFAERVFLCNSGAEANEAALKLARRFGVSRAPRKYGVLAFRGGFHGRIGMAMAATAAEKVRAGFGPPPPGFSFAEYNNAADAEAKADENLCAIIVEPVQGEGGVNPAEADFLRALRAIADRRDALLIYDEVQTGAGRGGFLYHYMSGDVVPDILTSAKGLGGGFPVAAMLAGARAADVLTVGAHGTTYGGNALSARAACAVLETLLADGFLAEVRRRAAVFAENMAALKAARRCFAGIRQSGLLIGADAADGWRAADMAHAALAEGVVVITAGENTLRLAPALNIPDTDIAEGFARLSRALARPPA